VNSLAAWARKGWWKENASTGKEFILILSLK